MRRLPAYVLAALSPLLLAAQTVKLDDQLQKLILAQSAISALYVDSVDNEALVESAITGMLKQLDPHSTYMDAEEVRASEEELLGNFEGIGIQFNMVDDTLLVVQTIPDGPSEKSGIMAGDRIVSANDTAIAGVKMSNSQIVSHLRGPKGTVVRLGVCRRNVSGIIFFDVIRDQIPLNTVDAVYMVDGKTGYIKLSSFGATTVSEIEDAIASLRKHGMETLILDLEGNGGGYLGAAVGVASEFLQRDNRIVYTEGRVGRNTSYLADGRGVFKKGNAVVLIDEYSASASEIVSGALQDWDRAVIIGRRSFGKGLVQTPVDFPDGSMIRLTVAKYYTPSGRCIQKPYGDDVDYRNDIAERLLRGELVSADSVHFADSLKYSTLVRKRTVYGGGGVMPDIFVPIDTTHTTRWYREANAHGAILQASLAYVERNRESLLARYGTFQTFSDEFSVDRELLDVVIGKASANGVEYVDEEFNKMLPYIKVQLKALVARGLWGMSEYYHIVNNLNPVYQRALEFVASGDSALY